MRSFYVFMVLVLSTLMASAQTTTTYRSELIDGNNTFNQTYEKFNTTRAQISAYVTWDADWLYIGYFGSTPNGPLTDDSRAIHIYIDTDPQLVPTTGTGTTGSDAWLWNPTLPFTANYHYVFKTGNNSEIKRKFNGGGSWGDASFSTGNWKNQTGNFWEIKISRADLGGTNAWNVLAYVEEDWNSGNAWITGGLPQGLFTDTQAQGNITFSNKFLNVQFLDKMAPNAPFHLQNWGWTVKLKAQSGSVKDETAMAGMFVNATDGYDAGIDLPKPPPSPSNFIDVFFPHASWGSSMGPNYERDFKLNANLSATTSTWDFSVSSDVVGDITLSASSFENVPSNYSITLKDSITNTETNLRTSTFTYTNTPGESVSRNFRLIIGVTLSEPSLQLSTNSINYGVIKTDKDSTVTVTITNTGDKTLLLQNLALTGTFFSLNGDTVTVLPKNASTTRNIKFAPRASGTFNGKLIITSNDPTGPDTVTLAGTGQSLSPNIVVYVDTLNFGNVIVGTPFARNFYVGNTGDTALTVSSVAVTGTGFSYSGSTSFSVAVRDSNELIVTFTPGTTGIARGTITITSNDPDQQNLVVQLKGNGSTGSVSNIFPAGWSLMSIPLNPVSNLATDILGDNLSSYFLYKYSGGAYSNSTTIDPGKGYWLGIEAADTVDVTGTPILSDKTDSLATSWNLIASPFAAGSLKSNIRIGSGQSFYTIDEAVILNLVQSNIYKYDNPTKTYENVTTLAPWNGHWFFTLQPGVTVKYLFSTPSDKLLPKDTPAFELTPSNWFVNIRSEMNDAKDNLLTFGTNEAATDGFDNVFDNVKPPVSPAANAIEAYFFQTNWLSLASKYASNIQAPLQNGVNKSWAFKVYAKAAGTFKLSWADIVSQIPQEIRDNYSFILKGPGIANGINMLTQTAYEFNAVANATYSFVINSSPVGIDDEAMNLDFKLAQNYPNPFNPSTTISFSIKEAGQVTLKVYDILGNEVTTLVNEVRQPGRYDVRFEAASLPSGTYFYKLVQGKNSEIKKLVLLK